ncbi:hypothetical protein HYH03_012153 [Edaphochlamys debaryana]|uniref:Uncharacterized protein n=1 Tax=Edaphochlamys debaryana TaxID=47281 RepID=A0A835XVW4_9CHLO|nr:hypothetical protein HYH03_012153 [Edaphochlamys debaryana]|eukprot:KAG2489321.1 hypothetical protein HYH03_012153 [Edaphochlamys debaryana]
MAAPIGTALLGTGIFAKDVWKKNLESKSKTGEVEVLAVWSRTPEAAQAYVAEHFPKAKGVGGDEGLQQILDDPAVQLVVVVLPVQASLPVVERCLAAGKAVVQEKPVAGTVEQAQAVIRAYRTKLLPAAPSPQAAPLWMFAENYRYEAVFVAACRRVKEVGRVIKIDLICDLPMDERNRYFSSAWRRDTALCPGGFFMDSSVHFIAGLRMLANAAGCGEAVTVAAVATQAKPELSFPDSVVGVATLESGAPASISISLAAHQVRWSLSVVGVDGTLEVLRGGWGGTRSEYTLGVVSKATQGEEVVRYGFSGCPDEFEDFLGSTRERAAGSPAPGPEARSSPEQGFGDLALVEALLASHAAGGQPVRVVQV